MLAAFLASLSDEQLNQMYWAELDTCISNGVATSPLLDAICHEQFLRWAEEEG